MTTPRTGEPAITHSARVDLTAALALGLCAACVNEARADLDANVKRCRADLVRIGEDPRLPYEQYCLGLSYQFALNRNRDSAKSLTWLRRAAAQNFAPAQAVLGYMLEQGIGTAKNPAEAVQWYRRSAEQNDPDGLMNLGRAHEHGIGVTRDLEQARTYYERASPMGSVPARNALKGPGSAPLAASRTSPPSPGVGTSCLCQSAGNRNVNRYCESAYSVVEASARASAGHAARVARSTAPRLRAGPCLMIRALYSTTGHPAAPLPLRAASVAEE